MLSTLSTVDPAIHAFEPEAAHGLDDCCGGAMLETTPCPILYTGSDDGERPVR